MRILTGKHRAEYETLLMKAAVVDGLKAILADTQKAVLMWMGAAEKDRQRADNAVDELLALRGIPPVTPADMRDLGHRNIFTEDPEKAAKIEADLKERGFGTER